MIMPKTVPEVLLYGTLGCHLCDDAMKLGLEALPKDVLIKQVDIVEDDKLVQSMGSRIPVMKLGSVELSWPFEKQDIQRLWRQKTAKRRYLL